MTKSAILVPMRIGSTRLPGKGLLPIAPGLSALALLAGRLRRATLPFRMVLCTTTAPEDDALATEASRLGIGTYRGDRDDVLARLTGAAHEAGADVVAEVDGDDLFCDPEMLDEALRRCMAIGADYFAFADLPLGIAANIVTRAALDRACAEKETSDTSTGIFNYVLKSGRFRVVRESAPVALQHAGLRATLDYPEDLEFFRQVTGAFPGRELTFTLTELLELVRGNPMIAAVNGHLDEQYWAHFRAKESSAAGRPHSKEVSDT